MMKSVLVVSGCLTAQLLSFEEPCANICMHRESEVFLVVDSHKV